MQIGPVIGMLIWTRYAYIDPKIHLVTVVMTFVVIGTCIVSILYIIGFRYPGDSCVSGQYFDISQNTCIPSISCMGGINACAVWDNRGSFSYCGRFNNQTLACSKT